MTHRVPCLPAPAPLEASVGQFDDCFASLARCRAFRDYLHGLLLPRERNKAGTAAPIDWLWMGRPIDGYVR